MPTAARRVEAASTKSDQVTSHYHPSVRLICSGVTQQFEAKMSALRGAEQRETLRKMRARVNERVRGVSRCCARICRRRG